jgi:hypothetical protein
MRISNAKSWPVRFEAGFSSASLGSYTPPDWHAVDELHKWHVVGMTRSMRELNTMDAASFGEETTPRLGSMEMWMDGKPVARASANRDPKIGQPTVRTALFPLVGRSSAVLVGIGYPRTLPTGRACKAALTTAPAPLANDRQMRARGSWLSSFWRGGVS